MIDTKKFLPDIGKLYTETINELYKQNYNDIITKITNEKKKEKGEREKYYISIYNMNCQPDYK